MPTCSDGQQGHLTQAGACAAQGGCALTPNRDAGFEALHELGKAKNCTKSKTVKSKKKLLKVLGWICKWNRKEATHTNDTTEIDSIMLYTFSHVYCNDYHSLSFSRPLLKLQPSPFGQLASTPHLQIRPRSKVLDLLFSMLWQGLSIDTCSLGGQSTPMESRSP